MTIAIFAFMCCGVVTAGVAMFFAVGWLVDWLLDDPALAVGAAMLVFGVGETLATVYLVLPAWRILIGGAA